ncbi:TPA: hypothetical protein PTV74_001395 [Clostridium botulinum]|uniref:hypothetical protein n=1 Tax=Clostridium botulinum TaxID=1491 RepID=UPI000D0CF44A|nr:hypothetical protein [Clostridium botulinum]PSM00384.1 hypothetical protein C6C12_11640 [Clostridium botulinum]HDK7138917.1 hypothetical protein [Clostridium botulinum]HDK7142246.1 hypothetical protein [Clostridium botulinum]HDK7144140.1 hypothetical protein [Clostridium botulinum]HDK7147792.1 hypothetical protein [Clostridium botulinum]
MNGTLDEFDLAGLKLTEEQKNQFRKFDADMMKIANLLGEFNKDKLNELAALARKLGENKPRTKMWGKNRFYK